MRYITIPDVHADIINEKGDIVGTASWTDMVRTLFRDQRLIQGIDLFTMVDLRKGLLSGKPGDVVKCEDDAWSVLCTVIKRSTTFSPDFLFSPGAEAMFRAILDAPSKEPG